MTVMATILLAQLLHMTNTILPPGYFSDAHVLRQLIASAMAFGAGEQRNERMLVYLFKSSLFLSYAYHVVENFGEHKK